jgi:hypothetical protein
MQNNSQKVWHKYTRRIPKLYARTCNAKTRKGLPCQAPPVKDRRTGRIKNGRCKLHGGLSTGPKTEAGKEAIRESNRMRRPQINDNQTDQFE